MRGWLQLAMRTDVAMLRQRSCRMMRSDSQRVDYGGRGRVGCDDDAVRADFVECASGDGADGDDREFILRCAQPLAAGEIGEIMYGARAEEKDGVGFAIDYGIYAGLIRVVRRIVR